uniref:Uncharacterized protein n=1 Tax=Homalodisca liturata TaxID=320908 RepID=A0A1B6IWW7_9HEMI
MLHLQQLRDDVPGTFRIRFPLEDEEDGIDSGEDASEDYSDVLLRTFSEHKHRRQEDDFGCCWWKIVRNCLCPWIVPRQRFVTSTSSRREYYLCDRSDDDLIPYSRSNIPRPQVYIPPAHPVVPSPQVPPQIQPQR